MDDFRFVRLQAEIPPPLPDAEGDLYRTFVKGGRSVKFFQDVSTAIRWSEDGRELKAFVAAVRERNGWSPHWTAVLNGHESYGRPGITWPLRGAEFSPQAMPAGSVFSVRGPAAFTSTNDLLATLGVLSSSAVDLMFKTRVGRTGHPEFVVGVLNDLPYPALGQDEERRLAISRLAHRGWSIRRSLDSAVETSHAFVIPAALQVTSETFALRVAEWANRVDDVAVELRRVQVQIDELCFELYGISEDDRVALTVGFGTVENAGESDLEVDEPRDDDGEGDVVDADPAGLAAGLVSWAVGVAVGRFDLRVATGERVWPAEPDPFEPLPACSPAMLSGDGAVPLGQVPPEYPIEVAPVLVDDPGHPLDLTTRVRAVFDVVFGDDADAWWVDVGEALGVRSGEIKAWLSKGFFDHHLKTHSKSRRKAPILWPIGTNSGSYTVWLYAHRATADSLFQMLNDIVDPKLGVEQRRLVELTQEAGPNPSAIQRKAIDSQERLVDELRELRDELVAVAPLWAPDLNDGVVIVLAPLWKLFAHHRAWSKELKGHWDKLAAGDYDWAQLAMHLWPERVIPKCAEDRSLAIAHHLEDEFWVQDPDNPDKWHPRTTPTTPIDQLITHHTVLPPGSPAT